MTVSIWGSSGTVNAAQSGTIVPQSFTGTAGQTLFTLTNFTYTVGTNSLEVFINGSLQISGRDYVETSSSSFTLLQGVIVGDNVDVFGVVAFTPSAVTPGSILLGGTYTLSSYISDQVINVQQYPYLALGNGVADDTAAIQAALTAATSSGRSVFFPAGTYIVSSTLLVGTQSVTPNIQSTAPTAIFGEGWQSIIKAGPAFTGTLMQSWSVAGMTVYNLVLDANNTATQYWDSKWQVGTAPSTQNYFVRVRGVNAPAAGVTKPLMNFDYCNDTILFGVIANAANHAHCAISFVAPGGLTWIDSCIWNGGYLNFGSQNGQIQNSWGMGIQFSSGALNYTHINGCYLYANTNSQAILWSQSFASFQSVRALTCTATQFITSLNTVTQYFNLNAYSTLDFNGCQWIGPTTTMFGASCRSDSFAAVLCKFRGGSVSIAGLSFTEPTTLWSVECENVLIDATGHAVNKNRGGTFVPVIAGATTAGIGTYTTQSGAYYRIGNRIFFELRVTWTAHTGTGQLRITGFPGTQTGSNVGVSPGFLGNTFGGTAVIGGISGNLVTFYSFAGVAGAMNAVGDMIISGNYEVTSD